MTSGGADALKAALRRSLPIIIGLAVLGLIAVNLFEHLEGAKYQASASVEVSSTTLAQILTGTTPPLIDPQQTQDTAQVLAGAAQVYRLAATQTHGRFGSASSMQSATTVTAVANTDLLSFASTGTTGAQAVGVANASASAFVNYSAAVGSAQISTSIAALQASLAGASPAARTVTEAEISKLQLLKLSSSSDTVLVQPAVSANKTNPAPAKDSVIGLAVGLVIGLLLVALREAVDTTVRSESDVEELLGAPVLATIRSLPRRTQIVTVGRYEAVYGDVYALLAAHLVGDSRAGERSVLAITSALAGEGKTTTVANLAVAMARRGHRILLADFDFHKPTLSNLFGVPVSAAGALQVLDGLDTLEDALWEISFDGVRPTAARRASPDRIETRRTPRLIDGRADTEGSLVILPSGKSDNTSVAGRTARMGGLLRELSTYSDFVILDTAPALLTVELTELAQLIDMVVVVVRHGHVSQSTLRALGRQARTWPAELAGAVMTDVPVAGTYGSYYGSK